MIIHLRGLEIGDCNKCILISPGFDARTDGVIILAQHGASIRGINSWVQELIRNSEHHSINLIVLLQSSWLEQHVELNFIADTSLTIVE